MQTAYDAPASDADADLDDALNDHVLENYRLCMCI